MNLGRHTLTSKNLARRVSLLVAGLLIVASLAIPGQALAQGNSQCQAYNPQVPCEPPVQKSSGTLPFTGIDVVLLAAGGAVMLAAGLGIRRLSRHLG